VTIHPNLHPIPELDEIPVSVLEDVRRRLAALPVDDTLATTFEPIPCMDCTEIGLSAVACDLKHRHEREHGRKRAAR
jgi:hypothetical protein